MYRIAVVALVGSWLVEPVGADVVVLANRTSVDIPLQIVEKGAAGQTIRFASLDVISIPTQGKQEIQVTLSQRRTRIQLDANCAYFFGKREDGTISIQQIGLNETNATRRGRKLPGPIGRTAIVRVRLFVDEEEPARTELWQRRLRQRVAQASDILQRQCGVKLQVVGFGTWDSDDSRPEFAQAFGEFEGEVKTAPSEVAIGFTSQYEVVSGRTHLGGIRGPLHSHILLREWSRRVNERERLELLVHK